MIVQIRLIIDNDKKTITNGNSLPMQISWNIRDNFANKSIVTGDAMEPKLETTSEDVVDTEILQTKNGPIKIVYVGGKQAATTRFFVDAYKSSCRIRKQKLIDNSIKLSE